MLEKQKTGDCHQQGDDKYCRIAVLRIKLRHVLEVHAIPAGYQGQRAEDGGNDGKDRHDVILLVSQVGVVVSTDLGGIVNQSSAHVKQPAGSFGKQGEVTDIVFAKEVVLVFFQFLSQIDQPVIVSS